MGTVMHTLHVPSLPTTSHRARSATTRLVAWSTWVVLALLALDLFGGVAYLAAVAVSGVALHLLVDPPHARTRSTTLVRDLEVVGGLYLVVVGLLSAAFLGFGTERTLGMFLCFAAALVIG